MVGAIPDVGFSSESPLAINHPDFLVYQDTIDRYDFKEERKFDSLTTTLVEQCRKKKKQIRTPKKVYVAMSPKRCYTIYMSR